MGKGKDGGGGEATKHASWWVNFTARHPPLLAMLPPAHNDLGALISKVSACDLGQWREQRELARSGVSGLSGLAVVGRGHISNTPSAT
jgi:hypothetical protein